jgi:uncharacterized protein (TIGR02118 family)
MIKISVMYPNEPDGRFNLEYYRDKHMPFLKAQMGAYCKSYAIDHGIGGGTPGAPATYIAVGHIFCDTLEDFHAGFGGRIDEILEDVENFTNLMPVIQINEVLIG